MSINKVLITGNLTRDPEVRTTASGSQILSFSVAVNDRRRDPNTNEWTDYANFIDCTMFGNRVDFFARNLSKGSKVAVEGKLRWSQWESKDGSGKRSKIEVIVDDMELMSRGDNNGGGNYSPAPTANYAPQPTYAPQPSYQAGAGYTAGGYSPAIQAPTIDATSSVYDEDIPF